MSMSPGYPIVTYKGQRLPLMFWCPDYAIVRMPDGVRLQVPLDSVQKDPA